jgi:hypothetical protein
MSEQPVGKIYSAMAGVMNDMVAIGKDKKNQQQGFNYRGIDDAYNALQPILAKNGIFNVPEVLEKWREERTNAKGTILAFTVLRMKYTFYAEDGSSVYCIVEGEGMDSGDKSSNKAMAIAHKYALMQTFCVPTEITDDPDQHVHEVGPKFSKEQMEVLLERYLAGATSVDELRSLFNPAMSQAGFAKGTSDFDKWMKLFQAKSSVLKASMSAHDVKASV